MTKRRLDRERIREDTYFTVVFRLCPTPFVVLFQKSERLATFGIVLSEVAEREREGV